LEIADIDIASLERQAFLDLAILSLGDFHHLSSHLWH
jgi:hypothetical protein